MLFAFAFDTNNKAMLTYHWNRCGSMWRASHKHKGS